MKKSILFTVVCSSILMANNDSEIVKFLTNALNSNQSLENPKITMLRHENLDHPKNWSAELIKISATLKQKGGKSVPVSETNTYFTDGRFLVNNMTDMKTGERISLDIKFPSKYYLKENLISGNVNSKHKVVIFSDPLCPFCKSKVPKALKFMMKKQDLYAVYYFDFPLKRIHPASETIVKIKDFLVNQKKETPLNATLEMYDFEINPSVSNPAKIVKEFNKQMGYNISLKDIQGKNISKNLKKTMKIVEEIGIRSTPTFYFDGEHDKTGVKYRTILNKVK